MTGPVTGPMPSSGWTAPAASPATRVRAAYDRRAETDYTFDGIAVVIVLTIITFGIYGFYVFYQLMRRAREHNQRRLELLEAATDLAWEQTVARGLDGELRPAFERISLHLQPLRALTTEFREPAIWLVFVIGGSLVGGFVLGIVPWMIGLVFIDGDFVRHDVHEGAVEAELSAIYGLLGATVPAPDPSRVKGRENYAGRIVATVLTCGIYGFWWMADAMRAGNYHFQWNWPWEDALVPAVQSLSS